MRELFTVMKFTMKDMITRKSFIISLCIILIMIIVGFNVPNIIKKVSGGDNTEKVLIVDEQNIFGESLTTINSMGLGYNIETKQNVAENEIKEKIENGDIDSAIKVSEENNKLNLEYIVKSTSELSFSGAPNDLISTISAIYNNIQIQKMNLTEEQIKILNPEINIVVSQTDEEEVQGNVFIMMLISLVLFYAVYFCAQQVSSSITTEKTSRVMETLITSTKPRTIVIGKTLGIGIIGLLELLAIIVVSVTSAYFCLDKELLETVFDLSNMTLGLALITFVYFLLGYLLYALMFALTGSTVSKPEDIQSANSPVSIIAVVGFYLAYFSMMNPTSSINKYAAIIPISSPFCMPLRVMMGTATTGDILLSIGVLAITMIIIAKISIKVYSSAVLNYGAKLSIKDAIKMSKEEK